jgi:hypothetical protein
VEISLAGAMPEWERADLKHLAMASSQSSSPSWCWN